MTWNKVEPNPIVFHADAGGGNTYDIEIAGTTSRTVTFKVNGTAHGSLQDLPDLAFVKDLFTQIGAAL